MVLNRVQSARLGSAVVLVMTSFGTAVVVKRHKRLHIATETGEILYTPPDFIRSHIRSRADLQMLADVFTQCQRRDIVEIIKFESRFR